MGERDFTVENFSNEAAKAALLEILESLTKGEGAEALEEAREAVGTDMIGLMTRVFPLVTQIATEVVGNHGFSRDAAGVIQFEHMVRSLENDDPEIAELHAQLRSYFIPSHRLSLEEEPAVSAPIVLQSQESAP